MILRRCVPEVSNTPAILGEFPSGFCPQAMRRMCSRHLADDRPKEIRRKSNAATKCAMTLTTTHVMHAVRKEFPKPMYVVERPASRDATTDLNKSAWHTTRFAATTEFDSPRVQKTSLTEGEVGEWMAGQGH